MLNSREERRKFIKENKYKYPLAINLIETNGVTSTLSEWLQQLNDKHLEIYCEPLKDEKCDENYDLVLSTTLIFQKDGKTEFTEDEIIEGVNGLLMKLRIERYSRMGIFESPDLKERWNVNEAFELKKTEEFAKIPQETLDKIFEERMSEE